MGFPLKFLFLACFIVVFIYPDSSAQIVFRELPRYTLKTEDSVFFDISSTRKIIPLNGEWIVASSTEKDAKKYSVSIPSIFDGEASLIFEKKFKINKLDLDRYKAKLVFFGINYTADISLNNIIIYRHSGGEFPFEVELPKDILRSDRENLITVKLDYRLVSESTIPLKQRFLFPQNYGGILRDVYIHLKPNISINDSKVNFTLNGKPVIRVKAKIENREFRRAADTISPAGQYSFSVYLRTPGSGGFSKSSEVFFPLASNKDFHINQAVDIGAPAYWSPDNPSSYKVRLELRRGDLLLDRIDYETAAAGLKIARDSILLNGKAYSIKGVTYIPAYYNMGSLASYDMMEKDIRMIKSAGFNTVRFAKNVPHPYYLRLCRQYGLIAFIELPINFAPSDILLEPNFLVRSRNYLNNFLKAYSKYSSIIVMGIGGGFIPESDGHRKYIEELTKIIKSETGLLTYASFIRPPSEEIQNLDFYGVELFNTPAAEIDDTLKNSINVLGRGRLFISEATYTVNSGNSDGYLNEHSFEAQAKYFEDLLNYTEQNALSGFFINSMFDYSGEFASFNCGYSENNTYIIGLSGYDRSTSRLSYKVVAARLHNSERVTIPIGSKKDDAPMLFIVFGLVLAIVLGVLVNSGRKFREDSSRALLRPYNFFADIRDQRLMSGLQTTTLFFIIIGISSLLLSNLLYYFKMNIVFEKFVLAFGSTQLMHFLNYLSWNPLASLMWLMVLSGGAIILLVIVIKISSFFVRNKVFLTSAYFTAVWSFLPLVLLIPAGIILFRILDADVGNIYIYILLLIFTLWIIYRTIKGIYVIFDVNPGSVYFYSILLMAAVAGGVIFYFDFTNSLLSFVELVIKQYNVLR